MVQPKKVDSIIKVGNSPTGIVVDEINNLVYVTNYENGNVSCNKWYNKES